MQRRDDEAPAQAPASPQRAPCSPGQHRTSEGKAWVTGLPATTSVDRAMAPGPAPFLAPAPAIEQSLEPLAWCAEADRPWHAENAACSMHHTAVSTTASGLSAPKADSGVDLVDLAQLVELQDDEAAAALASHVINAELTRIESVSTQSVHEA